MKHTMLVLCLIVIVLVMLPTYKGPRVLENYMSPEECAHIITSANKTFDVSKLSNNSLVDTSVRDSQTSWLDHQEDPIIKAVVDRCMTHIDRPVCNCEKLQVLKYQEKGHYKPHYDADCLGEETNLGNQRLYTFILVLSDDFEGGETEFPNLKQKYKLKKGDVLLFNNFDNYGLCTSKALHGGVPVTSGTKYIANLWVRQYRYGS